MDLNFLASFLILDGDNCEAFIFKLLFKAFLSMSWPGDLE